MLLAAERLTADVALQTGMANRIGTLADAQAWAAEIAGFAPLALQHAKRVLNDDGAYRGSVARAPGAVRQGVGQPGRHRGPGGAHREAAAEVPGRLMVVRAALRFGVRYGVAAGRRLGVARAARRARRAGRLAGRDRRRWPRARRTTATGCSSTSNRRRRSASTARSSGMLVRDLDRRSARPARPSGPIPLVDARPPSRPRRRSRRQLVRPLLGADRGRRLPSARRSGLESTAARRRRPLAPQRMHEIPAPLEALARGGRGGDQPRPLRPPRHRHDPGSGAHPAGPVRRAARSRRAPAQVGDPRRVASSNSTGTRATRSAS